jgi:hypothetical protein
MCGLYRSAEIPIFRICVKMSDTEYDSINTMSDDGAVPAPLNPYRPPSPLEAHAFHATRGPNDTVNIEVGAEFWAGELLVVGVGSGNVKPPVPVFDRTAAFTRAPTESAGTLGPWMYKSRRADESGTHEFMYIVYLGPGCRNEETR